MHIGSVSYSLRYNIHCKYDDTSIYTHRQIIRTSQETRNKRMCTIMKHKNRPRQKKGQREFLHKPECVHSSLGFVVQRFALRSIRVRGERHIISCVLRLREDKQVRQTLAPSTNLVDLLLYSPLGLGIDACGASFLFRPDPFGFCTSSSYSSPSPSSSPSWTAAAALFPPFFPTAGPSSGFCSHFGQNHSPSGTAVRGGVRHSRW